MGAIRDFFNNQEERKQSELITVYQAIKFLKELDPEATANQISIILLSLHNKARLIYFDSIKDGFLYADKYKKDYIKSYLSYYGEDRFSNNIYAQEFFEERKQEKEINPDVLFPDEYCGWYRFDFYAFLDEQGITQETKEAPFLYAGATHGLLGDVVDEIIRLNPDKTIDKNKLINVLSLTNGFCFSHEPEDGTISLKEVKRHCDSASLYFPWNDKEVFFPPVIDDSTHQQEINTLTQRIAELEQALSNSRAEITRLQSEINNKHLPSDDCLLVNISSPYFPKEARLGLQAWIAITKNGTQDVSKVSPKQQITKELNNKKYQLSEKAKERLSTVFNWKEKGGNPSIS